MAKRFLLMIALLTFGFYVAGCSEGDESASVVNPNPSEVKFTGTISGVVYDTCERQLIEGAVVSVAYNGVVHSVTTKADGAFSFKDVPASSLDVNAFFSEEVEAPYYVSCDLSGNSKYGFTYIEPVFLYGSDLNDGDNGMEGDESGSGADTPVNGLAATVSFDIAPLNATISGIVFDVSTAREGTSAAVTLYRWSDSGNDGTPDINDTFTYVKQTTAAEDGTFTFSNVMPNLRYAFAVGKSGYTYASAGLQTTALIGPYIMLPITVGCGQTLAGASVSIWGNPEGDKTIPYIESILADSASVIDGDVIGALVDVLSVDFSEPMTVFGDSALKARGAVTPTASFTFEIFDDDDELMYGPVSVDNDDIIDDLDYGYTFAWSESGDVLNIALSYNDDVFDAGDILEWYEDEIDVGADTDDWYVRFVGTYTIEFDDQNPALADVNGVQWNTEDYGDYFVFPTGLDIQEFILGGTNDRTITFTSRWIEE